MRDIHAAAPWANRISEAAQAHAALCELRTATVAGQWPFADRPTGSESIDQSHRSLISPYACQRPSVASGRAPDGRHVNRRFTLSIDANEDIDLVIVQRTHLATP